MINYCTDAYYFSISSLNHQINMTSNKVCMNRYMLSLYFGCQYIGYFIDKSMSSMEIAFLL